MKLAIIIIILLVLFVVGCNCRCKIKPCDLETTPHTAITPASRPETEWQARHKEKLARIKQGRIDMLMIGDSITHGWEDQGKQLWEKYYAPRNTVNLGFAGDQTQHVLWRLDNGEIDNINPKLAVLLIGTNNSNGSDNSAQQIADGITAIVCKLRTKLPETKILILAIFPRGDEQQMQNENDPATYNPQWAKNDTANEFVSQLADNEMIFYLNINGYFLNDNGWLTRDIMPDLLHLDKQGYKIWAEAMEPDIKKLLSE